MRPAMAKAVAEAMGEAREESLAGVGTEVEAEEVQARSAGFPETAGLAVDRASSPWASTPARRRSGHRRPRNGGLCQAFRERGGIRGHWGDAHAAGIPQGDRQEG